MKIVCMTGSCGQYKNGECLSIYANQCDRQTIPDYVRITKERDLYKKSTLEFKSLYEQCSLNYQAAREEVKALTLALNEANVRIAGDAIKIESLVKERSSLESENYNIRLDVENLREEITNYKETVDALSVLVEYGSKYKVDCEALELALLRLLSDKHKK